MPTGRALHWVFKIPDRHETMKLYKDILGMKVLRHEEFHEGCKVTCNGPYAGRWSKTMIGYGSEDNHFVIELTYNYGIKSYQKGNDFIGITIKSREAIQRAKAENWPIKELDGKWVLEAPGGFQYFLLDEPQPTDEDPIVKVALSSSNLERTIDYWHGVLGLKIYSKEDKVVVFGFKDEQAKIEFHDIGKEVDHAEAYGRIAFSCPKAEQPGLEKKIQEKNHTILSPLTSLDTPGKATVTVVILADPDGYEICFVEDEGFRKLSIPDEDGDELLVKSVEKDKS